MNSSPKNSCGEVVFSNNVADFWRDLCCFALIFFRKTLSDDLKYIMKEHIDDESIFFKSEFGYTSENNILLVLKQVASV